MPIKKSKKQIKVLKPLKSKDLPATIGHLENVRMELKSDITSVRLEIKSVDAKVTGLDAKVAGLDAKVTSLDLKMTGLETRMDEKMTSLESRMDEKMTSLEGRMDAKMSNLEVRVDARITSFENNMNSKFEDMKSMNIRMLALLEEQNSRNRVALDGYAAVYEAQQRLEMRVDKIEKFQFDFQKNRDSK